LRLLIVVGVLALLVLGFSVWRILTATRGGDTGQAFAGTVLDSPKPVADIVLRSADGSKRSLGDFSGDYQLVFFGYTSCPDVCPLTMARLARIYRNLGEPDDLQVVMITVDPANDTPGDAQAYARKFHPDFIGPGGTSEEIDAAATEFFIGYSGSREDSHTDSMTLLDPQTRFTHSRTSFTWRRTWKRS
jgi:protein SCO1/2